MIGNIEQASFYMQLREILREKIETEEYAPCSMLPSEAELANDYAISRQTVHNAIDALVNEGLLRRAPGKGVFVLGERMNRDLEVLEGFTQTMLERNVVPSVKVIRKRLRYGNNEPVSLEEIFVPKYVIPKLTGIDMSVFSLYEVFDLYHVNLVEAYQTVDLVHLEQNDARLLDMDASLPVLLFECTSSDERGKIIEFSRSYTRGDKGCFHVHFKR